MITSDLVQPDISFFNKSAIMNVKQPCRFLSLLTIRTLPKEIKMRMPKKN